jgi:hypothetical protein
MIMPTSIEYNLEDLTNAIVKQAADDYRKALRGKGYSGKSASEVIVEVEKFFRSKYFNLLTNVKGEYLIEKLKEEYYEERKRNESNVNTSDPKSR